MILDASSSADLGGKLTTVEWDAGSGALGAPLPLPDGPPGQPPPSGLTELASFPSAGQYTLRVRVTDDSGQQAVATTTYVVKPPPPVPPVPLFSPSTIVAYVGDVFTFDATASYQAAPDQGCDPTVTHLLASYEWDFGDGGGPAQGSALASHAFGSPGIYNVILRVTDAGAAAGPAAATHAVLVFARPQSPTPPPAPPPAAPLPPKPAAVALPSGAVSMDAGGLVAVRLRCLSAPRACAGELRLSTRKPKTIVLASTSFSVAAGKSSVVHLRLSGAGRAIVRGGGTKGLVSTLTAVPRRTQATLTGVAGSIRLVSAATPHPSRRRPRPKHH